jgi:predicted nucleotidyltransferase
MGIQTSQGYRVYVEAWRARRAEQEVERREWAIRLREAAHACARRLVKDFGASKVYLFGSAVHEDWVHDRSDIDLAVEGLQEAHYFRALRELGELLPAGAELDLIELERAWPELAERVKKEGELLDAASQNRRLAG